MGGDKAPQIVIEGADKIASYAHNISFLFFGDSKKVIPITNHCRFLKGRFEVIHTDEVVAADEKPSVALRRLIKSSMRLAIDAVKDGKANAVISAGNTGALMAISKVVLRTLPSISRPAIVTSMPNRQDKATVFLDMGANIDCDASVLFQFAVMGRAFCRSVLKVSDPKIGVLNVGSEEGKGHEELHKLAEMIRNSKLSKDFVGNVEGDDIAKGDVDVIVTDGFTGNITLKAIEGTAKLISKVVKEGFLASIFSKLGYLLAASSFTKAMKKIDPRLYNGAMLIGLNGIVIKSHGGTDSIGFANAIKVCLSLLENDINEKISAEIAEFETSIEAKSKNQDNSN